MQPVLFARVGCKHYERKPIYLVLWPKYKYCVKGVNMTHNYLKDIFSQCLNVIHVLVHIQVWCIVMKNLVGGKILFNIFRII